MAGSEVGDAGNLPGRTRRRAANLAPLTLLITSMTSRALALASLLLVGCAAPPPQVEAPVAGLQQAWVQAVAGPGWAVRALTGDASCPTMRRPDDAGAQRARR
jgi:hypothetical protein